jgi:NADH-quinone oxidoreductase subunit F
LTVQTLFDQGFKALFLSIGAHEPIPLGIKGEEAEGVIQGLTYLKMLNLGEPVPQGKKVAVIGGGNVAIDVSRSAIRKGAEDVAIFYRRTRREMPAYQTEIEEALEEGIRMTYLTSPEEVRVQNSKVIGLRCIKMELGEPDASGRRRPIPIAGSEFDVEADLVIVAIGQSPSLSALNQAQALETTPMRTIKVDHQTLATNMEGVFAGGDAVTGPTTVIEAIASGKKAAVAIDAFVQGIEIPENPSFPKRRLHVERFEVSEEKMGQLRRPELPLLPIGKRKSTFEQVELGLSERVARHEAQRCLRCDLS